MFRTPYEILQSQLRGLRVTMVEVLREAATIFPVFDDHGRCSFLLLDTCRRSRGRDRGVDGDRILVVSEFPLEIRVGKAIYSRPVAQACPLDGFPSDRLAGLWHMDPWGRLIQHTAVPEPTGRWLREANLALRERDGERVTEVCYSLDLRRVTGVMTRRGLLRRRRVEGRELPVFLVPLS